MSSNAKGGAGDWLQRHLPQIVVAPAFVATIIFVYVFILLTIALSFTGSTRNWDFTDFVGLGQYVRLWSAGPWITSVQNLAIFSLLYIGVGSLLGLFLAILIDQRIRAEGVFRTIYLYPMALSFIVTGTAWKWFLDPGVGLELIVQNWGWTSFSFDWIKNSDFAIYTVVMAGIWQSSGFVMAMFLAGLRGVDDEIIKAAKMDGASTYNVYSRIIIPMMRPVFLSAFVVLAHLAIKSYDLVVAMTAGGPGRSTWLPSVFMYEMTFTRQQIGLGAASAVMMLMTVAAIMVPYLWSELRTQRGGRHG